MSNTNILILPGGSRYDRYWAEDMKKILDKHFQFSVMHMYRHWRDVDDKNIDIFHESNEVREQHERLGGNYLLLASAEGIVVALKAIHEKKLMPKGCIFIGYPYSWTKGMKFDDEAREWLSSLQLPSLFIQAQFDPYCSFEFLQEQVLSGKMNNKKLQQIYGSDAHYDDIYALSEATKSFSQEIQG